jgi:hypothetical protein
VRILFETIGVLVHYNFALPHYLTRTEKIEEVHLLSSLFPIIMGGHHYILKSSRKKLRVTLYRSGIDFIDRLYFSDIIKNSMLKRVVQRYHRYDTPDYVYERDCRARGLKF